MHDMMIMQGFESMQNLNEDIPNQIFLQILFALLMLLYLLHQITAISMLHHHTNPTTLLRYTIAI